MGIIKALQEKDLVKGTSQEEVYPVTSDLGVYNVNSVKSSDYMPSININAFNNNNDEFNDRITARNLVPENYKHAGLIITYRYNNSWYTEQFIGVVREGIVWSSDDYWQSLNISENSNNGILDTTTDKPQDLSSSESMGGTIKLHKVSKTGKNTDLVEYVGKRNENLGEIFNTYEGTTRNIADGPGSHAEGISNKVSGEYSHVEGTRNIIKEGGNNSHVEGSDNSIESASFIIIDGSHVEGNCNILVKGNYSHIEGYKNKIWHDTTHIQGIGNISEGRSMHIFGEYANTNNTTTRPQQGSRGVYVEIVGNGEGENNKSNARTLSWNGVEWVAQDVTCGIDSNGNPLHKLSEKFSSINLSSDYTLNNIDIFTASNTPASIEAVNEVYRLLQGFKKAYVFNSAGVNTNEELSLVTSLNNADQSKYEVGSQLLITETGVTDFWICEVLDESIPYTFTTNQDLEAYTVNGGQIGHYKIVQLETAQVDLSGYQLRLYSDTSEEHNQNIKTVFGQSLLGTGNINPTKNVITEENIDIPVSGQAVVNYINNNTLNVGNIKTIKYLNTQGSIPTNSSESLLDLSEDHTDTFLNLHRVSKTGLNIDLVDFVGMRADGEGSIIFNYYGQELGAASTNVITGSYSSVFGKGNRTSGNYNALFGSYNSSSYNNTFMFGEGLISNYEPNRFIIGKYNRDITNSAAFIIGNGSSGEDRKNSYIIYKDGTSWTHGKITLGILNNGIPDITTFDDNQLVHKYYVDQQLQTAGLYKGLRMMNNATVLPEPSEGTLFSMLGNAIPFTYYDDNTNSMESYSFDNNTLNGPNKWRYVLGIKDPSRSNSKLYTFADLIKFTSNPNKIKSEYLIGGTNQVNENAKPAIMLHNIARTGNYNDLINTPNIPSPSIFTFNGTYNVDPTTQEIVGVSINDFDRTSFAEAFSTYQTILLKITDSTDSPTLVDYYMFNSLHRNDTIYENTIDNLKDGVLKRDYLFTRVEDTSRLNSSSIFNHTLQTITLKFYGNQGEVGTWDYYSSTLSNSYSSLVGIPTTAGEANNVHITNCTIENGNIISSVNSIDTLNNAVNDLKELILILRSGNTTSTFIGEKINNNEFKYKTCVSYSINNSNQPQWSWDEITASVSNGTLHWYKITKNKTNYFLVDTESTHSLVARADEEINTIGNDIDPNSVDNIKTLQLHKISKTGSYNDLNNKPTLATVATTGNYNDLVNKPNLTTSLYTLATFPDDSSNIIVDVDQAYNSYISYTASNDPYITIKLQGGDTDHQVLGYTQYIAIDNTGGQVSTVSIDISGITFSDKIVKASSNTFQINPGETLEFSIVVVDGINDAPYIVITTYEGLHRL